VFELLGAESIGLTLSHGFAVEPEQSTVAIVAHHPQASYFGMRSGRIPPERGAGTQVAAEAEAQAAT
jgi:5-methyltetrahydrofolate--homocysteine methyltransferase